MPEYLHKCSDENCSYEWEDTYSIKLEPPKICPKCNQETAKRLINGFGGGRMEPNIEELKIKIKEDSVKLRKELYRNENAYANFVGESSYNKTR